MSETPHVLITGGAGYIGSHTAKRFHQAGIQPVVVDDLRRGHRGAVKWGPLIEADAGDQATMQKVFRQYPITAVIHFAAYAYVGESMRYPEMYFRNNVVSTLNLLEAMRHEGVRKIVFSSTCATYGHPRQVPIAEDHPQQPVNPYGESKLMVEKILKWYGEAHGIASVALRYFNAAGTDPEGELGEDHAPETHLIPLALSAVLGETPALQIFGTDYPTPDGTAVRDYLHVADLAEAHLDAWRYLDAGGASGAFNLGTGKGHSVREIIAAVTRVTGRAVPAAEAQRREGDPACLVADARRAGEVLQWKPRHSSLEEIVETAWKWKTRGARLAATVRESAPAESSL